MIQPLTTEEQHVLNGLLQRQKDWEQRHYVAAEAIVRDIWGDLVPTGPSRTRHPS